MAKLKGKKNIGTKFFEWLFPFVDKYSPVDEALKLEKDKTMKELGVSAEVLIPYLEQARNEHKNLMTYAKLADSLDRWTSLIDQLQPVPGAENVVELAYKLPFLVWCYRNDHTEYFPRLLVEEGVEVIPVVGIIGDAIDILGNRYMSVAYDIVRQKAKERLLRERQDRGSLESLVKKV